MPVRVRPRAPELLRSSQIGADEETDPQKAEHPGLPAQVAGLRLMFVCPLTTALSKQKPRQTGGVCMSRAGY